MWRVEGFLATWTSKRLRAIVDLKRPDMGLQLLRRSADSAVPSPMPRTPGLAGERDWVSGKCSSAARLKHHDSAVPHLAVMQVHLGLDPSKSDVVPSEHCVRGADLIAVYEATEQRPLRTEVYWRLHNSPDFPDISLIDGLVSTQTQRLDSDPRIRVDCHVPMPHCLVSHKADIKADFAPAAPEVARPSLIDIPIAGRALLFRSADLDWSFGQVIHASDVVRVELRSVGEGQGFESRTTLFGGRLEKGVIRRAVVRSMIMPSEEDEQAVARQLRNVVISAPPLAT